MCVNILQFFFSFLYLLFPWYAFICYLLLFLLWLQVYCSKDFVLFFVVYWCCSFLSFFLSAVSATCSMRFCFLFVCDCPGLDPFYLFLVSFVNVSKVWFKFTLVLVFPYWFLLNRFFHPPVNVSCVVRRMFDWLFDRFIFVCLSFWVLINWRLFGDI